MQILAGPHGLSSVKIPEEQSTTKPVHSQAADFTIAPGAFCQHKIWKITNMLRATRCSGLGEQGWALGDDWEEPDAEEFESGMGEFDSRGGGDIVCAPQHVQSSFFWQRTRNSLSSLSVSSGDAPSLPIDECTFGLAPEDPLSRSRSPDQDIQGHYTDHAGQEVRNQETFSHGVPSHHDNSLSQSPQHLF